ncbi:hemerythrin domain-containing protein [Laspinema olomoucense]|uniref:Hemerythrin domain-containing protein n=1 Tax=Laspinema olomoucense D3b TaxID=2953688 RepID=A0ABT2N2W9_9CYAN|nr:hemerythrin domain-containing protein [Laspinema sp. D3b]MCT7977013.1 hemerythrin domain-containing protein [Laspinema sp. D3b]
MTVQLQDTKRMAIAQKLADMKAVQNFLISSEEKFISATSDSDIRDRLQSMLEDDRKNLGIIETTIIQYGNPSEPDSATEETLKQAQKMMEDSQATLFDKISKHELLKHAQVMKGLLVHKAAQVVGADIEVAITPLNTVNFENRSHQEQLKGILEVLGTRELTGQDPDQGVWSRVQDAMAALSGVFGSAVSRTKDDVNILEILRADHRKADTLFMEIEKTSDAKKREEFFGQLYKDLSAHAEAEEEVVYPAIRAQFPEVQHLYNEQAEMKQLLEAIKSSNGSDASFMTRVKQLKEMVQHHVKEEENEMFNKFQQAMNESQMEQVSKQFKEAKSRIQQSMAS